MENILVAAWFGVLAIVALVRFKFGPWDAILALLTLVATVVAAYVDGQSAESQGQGAPFWWVTISVLALVGFLAFMTLLLLAGWFGVCWLPRLKGNEWCEVWGGIF